MKLEKFNKHKKQKEIIIGSIIGLTIIIGGISLYRSFAMYEEKATFDVLKGTVPDFSGADINLAFTIDGQKVSGKGFPNKNSGYAVKNVNCENDVTADWNNYKWNLENIKNPQNTPKIKCNIDFIEIYTEKDLNGADPVLSEELVPVEIGDNGAVKKADIADSWYSYADKQWANAVILVEGKTAEDYKDNAEIPEEDIESYFVWIPKYRYQIQTIGVSQTGQEKPFSIKFGLDNTTDNETECKTPMNKEGTQGASGESGNCEKDKWMTHPAFLAFDTNGLWVGKFETGHKSGKVSSEQQYNVAEIVVKPNQYSYSYMNISNQFQASYYYKRTLDSHMLKNTEWGAVAYLTNSIYGRCNEQNGDITCENVMVNNTSNFVTGYASTNGYTNTGVSVTPGNNGANIVNYFDSKSVVASTTNNYSGIYDMSGGILDNTMGVSLSADGTPYTGGDATHNSGFNGPYSPRTGGSKTDGVPFPQEKYYDGYKYGTTSNDAAAYSRRILGDATAETKGWYGGREDMVGAQEWANRGSVGGCGTHVFLVK